MNNPSSSADARRKPRKKRSRVGEFAGVMIGEPTPPMITHPCTECGKKFLSLKALFGHMRCHPEREWRGINPPENLQRVTVDEESSSLDEDYEIASCLLMMANGPPAYQSPSVLTTHPPSPESTGGNVCEEKTVDCEFKLGFSPSFGLFKCTSCKKVFASHQALGGHRASHKNVKGCHAITKHDGEDEFHGGKSFKDTTPMKVDNITNGHKCNICLKAFSSGQALGGHMRCHWEKTERPPPPPPLVAGFDLNLNSDAETNDGSSCRSSADITLNLILGLGH